jgi:hypothetical protein
MGPVDDPSANAEWWRHRDARAEAFAREQQKLSDYYGNLTKQTEERRRREEREAFEQAQSRRSF